MTHCPADACPVAGTGRQGASGAIHYCLPSSRGDEFVPGEGKGGVNRPMTAWWIGGQPVVAEPGPGRRESGQGQAGAAWGPRRVGVRQEVGQGWGEGRVGGPVTFPSFMAFSTKYFDRLCALHPRTPKWLFPT